MQPGPRRRDHLAPVAHPAVRPPRASRVPRSMAVIVASAGLVTLVSVAFPISSNPARIFSEVVPLTARTSAASVGALAGLGLLVIAGGLARRQRRAWALALGLLVAAGVAHMLRDFDVPQAGLTFGLAVVLASSRREFYARSGPGSIPRAIAALPGLVGIAWAFGWLAIATHAGDFVPRPSIGQAAVGSIRGLVGLSLGARALVPTGAWIAGVLPLLGVVILVVGFAAVLRPVVEGAHDPPEALSRARDLVRRWGTDTLSYFALRPDKNHFIHGDAVVSYRYLWNLGLVSGDPVGDPEDVPRAIEGFVAYARERGWGVAVLAASGDHAETYARLGLRSFYLGDEAVLDPRTFSLEGRAIRKVRQSCHRLERAGYRIEWVEDAELSPDLRDALESVSSSWRGRAPERGFTMALGRAPSPLDPGCATVVARDAAGRAQGYLHLVPCAGDEPGYSLDQMRRRPGTPNGLTEWMVARTALALGARQFARISLNFAFLGALFRHNARMSLGQRLEAAIARRLNPFFQIERLHSFNAKFGPKWVPRYIFYEVPLSFPRVALAYLEAETFPLRGIRRVRRGRERFGRTTSKT